MLGAEHEHDVVVFAEPVIATHTRVAGVLHQRIQDALGGATREIARRCELHDRHDRGRALVGTEPALHVHRRPVAGFFVLAEAERVAQRPRERRAIEKAGDGAAHIADDESQRAADGRVGAEPGPEAAGVTVHADLVADGPVDDHGVCRARQRAGGRVAIAHRIEMRPHCRDDRGEVLGLAPGHHRVDRCLLGGDHDLARRHRAEQRVGLEAGNAQEALDLFGCGRDDRQPVGPTLFEIVLEQGVVVVVLVTFSGESHGTTVLISNRFVP